MSVTSLSDRLSSDKALPPQDFILATKLVVPAGRNEVVVRQRLLDKLGTDKLYPLTLVSAPAGFGR